MDHLKTDEERKDRWYSRRRRPRFVEVVPATDCSQFDDDGQYEVVRSVPYEWISNPPSEWNLSSMLQTHGFLVISGVLAVEECTAALSLAWDWVKAATVIEQARAESLDASQIQQLYDFLKTKKEYILSSRYFPRSVEGGILPFYGSGHSSFAWNVRSNSKVKAVFESIYGTSNLISSLDGIVLWRPEEENRTDAGWFHVDQNPSTKPGFESVQGLVNLLPVSPAVGGNVLVAQSNHLFPNHYLETEFYRDRLVELQGDDWMEVPHDDDKVFQNRGKILSCQLRPGDMLLWDSRTVHCSYPGRQDEAESDTRANTDNDDGLTTTANGIIRAATLVSMMPRERASSVTIQQRQQAVNSGRTLTHWATKVAPLGEEREEEVAMEATCINLMKNLRGPKVLLDFDDLNDEQKGMVVGDR